MADIFILLLLYQDWSYIYKVYTTGTKPKCRGRSGGARGAPFGIVVLDFWFVIKYFFYLCPPSFNNISGSFYGLCLPPFQNISGSTPDMCSSKRFVSSLEVECFLTMHKSSRTMQLSHNHASTFSLTFLISCDHPSYCF